RAGQRGLAVSLVAPAELHRARAIETHFAGSLSWHPLSSLKPRAGGVLEPTMVTLGIAAGRKDKLRPGDVLGALTKEAGLSADQVGKITITDQQGFVAVHRDAADQALKRLSTGKIKGRALRVRVLAMPGHQ
ncbi:MAG: ATP-dependent RNA helicase DbpA, partial [Gammaproteobacteria bacterium HGW-Gammaproteobacteria-14]